MKTYFAYIRVSTAKQGQYGSSLQEQRDAILAFAARSGFSITYWFEDRETAAKKGRTQFVRMMTALEKRKAAGVILHKIDRGARNLWDWAKLQDLIDVGIEVHFVHDNLDLTSRGGRLAADIQAVVAADFVRNLRDETRKGMRGRVKQGLYPWKAPLGYLDQGRAMPKAIDPVVGPLVKVAFELYATRKYAFTTLSAELKRRGLMRPSGRPISKNGLTTILRNPFYAGLIRAKSMNETFQGIHRPLISMALFQAVQDVLDNKNNTKAVRHEFLLRRLLRCGLCQTSLIGERQKGIVYYRCHTATCETKGIREDEVVARLCVLAEEIQLRANDWNEVISYLHDDPKGLAEERANQVEAARLRVAALEERQQRLTDAYVDQAIDRQAYEQRKERLLIELAYAREALSQAQEGELTSPRTQVQEFLELGNALWLGPRPEFREEYREAVEKLTSNRVLTGKKLEITLRNPFCVMRIDEPVLYGVPSRDASRKRTGKRTKRRSKTVINLGNVWKLPMRERAQVIAKAMDAWAKEVNLKPRAEEQVRKALPHWFKPRSFPPDELNEAA